MHAKIYNTHRENFNNKIFSDHKHQNFTFRCKQNAVCCSKDTQCCRCTNRMLTFDKNCIASSNHFQSYLINENQKCSTNLLITAILAIHIAGHINYLYTLIFRTIILPTMIVFKNVQFPRSKCFKIRATTLIRATIARFFIFFVFFYY